jgi:ubiquinone/menaquinone biosynthesis C-methylase UbiE
MDSRGQDNTSRELAERVAREASYHEDVFENSARLQRRFSHVFECPNAAWAEAEHLSAVKTAVKGRDVLDYGCADGDMAAQLLAFGARHVSGLDISESAISRAHSRGLSNADFRVGDAHRLPWPDASFDVVVGRAILHHLNLKIATSELLRVLRPGGKLFFVEPLYHNPMAALFRLLTPHARTVDEKPLTRSEVKAIESQFVLREHGYSLLVSMPVGAVTALLPGLGPSNLLLRAADRLDRWLCRTPLRWWMGHIYLRLGDPRPDGAFERSANEADVTSRRG